MTKLEDTRKQLGNYREQPRPHDCPHSLSCEWYRVETDPDIGMYACRAADCPYTPRALASDQVTK